MGFYDDLFRGTRLDPRIYGEEYCGTCSSHLYDHDNLYTCQCRASPYYEEYTEYDDICDEYHERGTTKQRTVPDFED